MNLFASILTYPAPSANYRGESELSRTVIQKVTDRRFDYPIVSPEAMRNALRETLCEYGLPCNRKRIHPVSGEPKKDSDKEAKQQLAVIYSEYPEPTQFVDDYFFGYLLAVKGNELKKIRDARGSEFPLKRDSILRMNLAKGLEPYRHSTVFTQSPQFAEGNPWKPGSGESKANSSLLHRETAVTPFQYPFAINLNDCAAKPDWTKQLLKAIGELNGVAGNHARSYFEMAPASIVIRLTNQLVAGYETYGFKQICETADGVRYGFPEVVKGILHDPPDYDGTEFYIGGRIVKEMEESTIATLTERGVTLDRDPRRLINTVSEKAFA